MTLSTQVQLVRRPQGWPVPEDFRTVAVELPDLGPDQVRVANEFLSVDPYMRGRMNDAESYTPPYALGATTPETPARKNLLDATVAIGDLGGAVGEENLGENKDFEPTSYRFQSRAVDPSELATDPAPTIVEWPALTTLPLADATTCASLDAASGDALFADAKQNTYFKDGDVVYQLAVAGVLPGDPAC